VNPTNLERAKASIRAELERFLDEGPTDEEHADAISSLLGSLPRQLEQNEGVAAVLSEVELYGLGLDYLERYREVISDMPRQTPVEAARRWLRPDVLVTAVAGPPRDS
jgi:zinc protease